MASPYLLLFSGVLAANITLVILACTGHFSFGTLYAPQIAIGNVLLALLVRNELCLRCVFWLEYQLFRWQWVPLGLKHTVLHGQVNIGGIHSSCGVSSVIWLAYVAVLMCTQLWHSQPWLTKLLAFALLVTVLLSCLSAVPAVRDAAHEVFENIHRCAGWSSLGLLWAFVLLSDSYEPSTKSHRVQGRHLLLKMEFWCSILATVMVVSPWVSVRKVQVAAWASTNQMVVIRLAGHVGSGVLTRISQRPWYEWHAFATVCTSKTADSHVLMISALGDFTKGLVTKPPTCLYVRTLRFAGLAYLASIYSRVVMIATGAGVSPYLSNVFQDQNTIHLIWIGRNMCEMFAGEIWEALHEKLPPERLTIIDTAIAGRPNMVALACEAYRRMDAQAVFVGSNRAGTKTIMDGCCRHGIACFGPVWDS